MAAGRDARSPEFVIFSQLQRGIPLTVDIARLHRFGPRRQNGRTSQWGCGLCRFAFSAIFAVNYFNLWGAGLRTCEKIDFWRSFSKIGVFLSGLMIAFAGFVEGVCFDDPAGRQ